MNRKKYDTQLVKALSKEWRKSNGAIDEKMVDYCLKSTTYVKIKPFYIDIGQKETISKDLWYSDENEQGEHINAPDKNKALFIAYNLRLNSDQNIIEGLESNSLRLSIINDNDNTDLKRLSTLLYNEMPNKPLERIATKEESEIILNAMREKLEQYKIRLERYYKRYSDKVMTRTYWASR